MYEEPEHTTRFTTQLFTSDGVNRFPVTKEYVCTLMEYDAPIGTWSKFEYVYSDWEISNYCKGNAAMVPLPPTYHLVAGIDPEQEEALTGISFEQIQDDNTETGWGTRYNREFNLDTK